MASSNVDDSVSSDSHCIKQSLWRVATTNVKAIWLQHVCRCIFKRTCRRHCKLMFCSQGTRYFHLGFHSILVTLCLCSKLVFCSFLLIPAAAPHKVPLDFERALLRWRLRSGVSVEPNAGNVATPLFVNRTWVVRHTTQWPIFDYFCMIFICLYLKSRWARSRLSKVSFPSGTIWEGIHRYKMGLISGRKRGGSEIPNRVTQRNRRK